jgi:hypothetical protein
MVYPRGPQLAATTRQLAFGFIIRQSATASASAWARVMPAPAEVEVTTKVRGSEVMNRALSARRTPWATAPQAWLNSRMARQPAPVWRQAS